MNTALNARSWMRSNIILSDDPQQFQIRWQYFKCDSMEVLYNTRLAWHAIKFRRRTSTLTLWLASTQSSLNVYWSPVSHRLPWVPEVFLALFGRRHERQKNYEHELCCLRPKTRAAKPREKPHFSRGVTLKTRNWKPRMKSLWYPG